MVAPKDAATDIVPTPHSHATPQFTRATPRTRARQAGSESRAFSSLPPRDAIGRLPFARGRSSVVEHHLAKVGVEGSNPFVRSIDQIRRSVREASTWPAGPTFDFYTALPGAPKWRRGQVARQGPAKPLSPVRIRASPPAHIQAAHRAACAVLEMTLTTRAGLHYPGTPEPAPE